MLIKHDHDDNVLVSRSATMDSVDDGRLLTSIVRRRLITLTIMEEINYLNGYRGD